MMDSFLCSLQEKDSSFLSGGARVSRAVSDSDDHEDGGGTIDSRDGAWS